MSSPACKLFKSVHLLKIQIDKVIARSLSSAQFTVDVRNFKLNVNKVGNGKHAILCLPSALGYGQRDFAPQLQNLNPEKFTVIAWDPPGYGKSRPPNREYVSDSPRQTLLIDGDLAHDLMIKLGYNKYSLLGYSDGGITAIFTASSFPESVHRMVISGAAGFVSQKYRESCIKLRNIDNWSEESKQPMINLYGEEYFRKTWANWMDGFIEMYDKDGDICKGAIAAVNCPTLIVHGGSDDYVELAQARYLRKHIHYSRLCIIPGGRHDLHIQFATKFNNEVESFLLCEDCLSEPIPIFNSLIE